MFYIGKMYTGQIKEGESYDKLKKCIHVSILDFVHFPEDRRCYHRIAFCDTKTGAPYTDLMEIHILELAKLPEKARDEEGIIRWMRFFSGKNKEEFQAMAGQDQYIDEAYRELLKLSADEQKKLEYELRQRAVRDYNTQMGSALTQGREEGMRYGLEQGRQRGVRQGRQSIILAMLENGMEPEEICRLAGVTAEEIRAAQEQE